MVDDFILAAVKETSKEYKDLPNYDKLCEEHAEKVEEFMRIMLHTSRPPKNEPEQIGFMTQEPTRFDPAKLESGHMQIIPKCGTFGHDRIIKALKEFDEGKERQED